MGQVFGQYGFLVECEVGCQDQQQGWEDVVYVMGVEVVDVEVGLVQFIQDYLGDQEVGNDEEDIDVDEIVGQECWKCVIQQYVYDCDCVQVVDVCVVWFMCVGSNGGCCILVVYWGFLLIKC